MGDRPLRPAFFSMWCISPPGRRSYHRGPVRRVVMAMLGVAGVEAMNAAAAFIAAVTGGISLVFAYDEVRFRRRRSQYERQVREDGDEDPTLPLRRTWRPQRWVDPQPQPRPDSPPPPSPSADRGHDVPPPPTPGQQPGPAPAPNPNPMPSPVRPPVRDSVRPTVRDPQRDPVRPPQRDPGSTPPLPTGPPLRWWVDGGGRPPDAERPGQRPGSSGQPPAPSRWWQESQEQARG